MCEGLPMNQVDAEERIPTSQGRPDQLAMVIEDDEDAAEIVEAMLGLLGYDVEVFDHPHALLVRVAEIPPTS